MSTGILSGHHALIYDEQAGQSEIADVALAMIIKAPLGTIISVPEIVAAVNPAGGMDVFLDHVLDAPTGHLRLQLFCGFRFGGYRPPERIYRR